MTGRCATHSVQCILDSPVARQWHICSKDFRLRGGNALRTFDNLVEGLKLWRPAIFDTPRAIALRLVNFDATEKGLTDRYWFVDQRTGNAIGADGRGPHHDGPTH